MTPEQPFQFEPIPHDAGSAAPSDTGTMAVVEKQAPDIQARPRPASATAKPNALHWAGRCPECDGSGEVEQVPFNPSAATWRERCENCKGTGRAPGDWPAFERQVADLLEAAEAKDGDAVDTGLRKLAAAMGFRI